MEEEQWDGYDGEEGRKELIKEAMKQLSWLGIWRGGGINVQRTLVRAMCMLHDCRVHRRSVYLIVHTHTSTIPPQTPT